MLDFDIVSNQFVNTPDPEADGKVIAQARVDAYAAYRRQLVCAPTSPYEAASWALKLAEARAGGGPMLQLEAQARQITEAELIQRVIANADALAQLEAVLAGVAGYHRDKIKTMTDEEAVTYNWQDGWPE